MTWRPIADAPRDGTLLLLVVDYEAEDADNALEDKLRARTVGFNNLDCDGEDRWQFAGWCWSHDHFVEGRGAPILWQLLPEYEDAATAAD